MGSETARGAVPARLTPIFRDREELSAGRDLSEQVQAALAVSGALIVLCSPGAKASLWVDKEIEAFRAAHPDRPILAALIEGEPEQAFPAALTAAGQEPIAADFRKGGDGARLALLKLVAGLTGLGLDTLVQRDAQRQMRRVTVITLGALAAVLAMALLLVLALRAEREAETQRTQAEGLVEYMLTDLRDRLKGVGRLDVMTAVNERAMGYYGAQESLDKLPPESLDRRARILHAMGEDDEKRGDLGKALAKFTEAHRATAAVLAQRPNDADAIFAHAQSEYWVGFVSYMREDRPAALRRWEAYRSLALGLVKLAPGKPEWIRELGYAEGNLCALALDKPPEPKRALQKCEAALAQMERVAKLLPADGSAAKDIANRYAWLADAWKANGNIQKALDFRNRQRAILETLAKAGPEDFERKELLMKSYLELAETYAANCQLVEGAHYARLANSLMAQLISHDRQNDIWHKLKGKVDGLGRKFQRICEND